MKALKLGEQRAAELELNLNIRLAPTMAAFERYGGTLYKAMHRETFTDHEIEQMRKHVLIQSPLFGLISATDRIPWYRLSANTPLPTLNLKEVWKESQVGAWRRLVDFPIIDLRSKAYTELAPIPTELESYWVEVVAIDEHNQRRALNHFNKTAKGELVGAFVRAKSRPNTIGQLRSVARKAGLDLVVEGRIIYLITTEIMRSAR